MTTFADQLTAALKGVKMSRSELARRIDVPRCSVSDWCLGRHQPRQHQVDRINEALGTKLTLSRVITSEMVAEALGMCVDTLHRAMRNGQLSDMGIVIPSPSGKSFSYRFFPKVVAEKCGI